MLWAVGIGTAVHCSHILSPNQSYLLLEIGSVTNGSLVYQQLFSPEAGTDSLWGSAADALVKLGWQKERKAILMIFKPSILGIPQNLHISVITQVCLLERVNVRTRRVINSSS